MAVTNNGVTRSTKPGALPAVDPLSTNQAESSGKKTANPKPKNATKARAKGTGKASSKSTGGK